ncbi:hypothetical protein K504DRAFT_506531 [Pleomassaria siparia CBS 279.74]|uniref:Uncharacterized protein n=1 Tax=Pleomassaria siparia CBS 279.74 TaxID=1314801 RepID=A0A6G1JXX2_9PLEO|nr:hypothetical protein K504DRAFT_506531 [Pleomassaria siparia CBS 279.74]
MGCGPSRHSPRQDYSNYDSYHGTFPMNYRPEPVARGRSQRSQHHPHPQHHNSRYRDVSPPRNRHEMPRAHASQYSRRDVSPVREPPRCHRSLRHQANFRHGGVGDYHYY